MTHLSVPDWIFFQFPERSIGYILLANLAPAIVTVAISGVAVAILVPRLQDSLSAKRALYFRKVESLGDISACFQSYIMSWRRLRQYAEYELKKRPTKLTKDEQQRKLQYANERSEKKDKLFETLGRARGYFSTGAGDLIDKFMEWDEAQSTLTLEQLPDLRRWREWSKMISHALEKELLSK